MKGRACTQVRLSASPGVVHVRGEVLKRVPVIGEPDVLRVVQLLPGVVATTGLGVGTAQELVAYVD